ncbi:MAG: MarR family winged helix-turn-helix transcriptional regulator [Myxococcaceae bacterium]
MLDDIRRIVQSLRESARAVESDHGVSGAQLFVLQKLEEGGPATVGELAERTLTHQSSVSVVVGRLEKAGLVKRRPSKEDRRAVMVTLTPKGKSLATKAPDPAQLRLLEAVNSLSPSDQKKLAALLDRVVETMGLPQRAPPPMFFEEKRR